MQANILARFQWALFRFLERLGVLGKFAIGLLIVSIIFYISFYQHLSQDLQALKTINLQNKTNTRGLPVVNAFDEYIADFPVIYQREQYIKLLMDIAKIQNISLGEVRYKTIKLNSNSLTSFVMEFSVDAQYPEIQHFLSELLFSFKNVAIETLSFERKNIEQANVSANFRLKFYFKNN